MNLNAVMDEATANGMLFIIRLYNAANKPSLVSLKFNDNCAPQDITVHFSSRYLANTLDKRLDIESSRVLLRGRLILPTCCI